MVEEKWFIDGDLVFIQVHTEWCLDEDKDETSKPIKQLNDEYYACMPHENLKVSKHSKIRRTLTDTSENKNESKVDYTSEEFWKDAPEDAYQYATMDPWGEKNIYWLDNGGYWYNGKHYKFGESAEHTTNFVKNEFTIVSTRRKPQLIFTKAMQEAGGLPPIGSKFIDVELSDDDEVVEAIAHDVALGRVVYKRGSTLQDSEYFGATASECKPLDNRTNEEKAVDDSSKVLKDLLGTDCGSVSLAKAVLLDNICCDKITGVTWSGNNE